LSNLDGTQSSINDIAKGSVTFAKGIATTGSYRAYLLENESFRVISSELFLINTNTVRPVVYPVEKSYAPGQAITIVWTNGPANPNIFIKIYPEGVEPSWTGITMWCYSDGNKSGITGIHNGSCTFSQGIATTGLYRVFLFENDSFTVLSSELFLVETATASFA
jgi:hypothetical protein